VVDNFYKAFEDQYRGSRALIQSRLKFYLPFLEPLKSHYGSGQTVDLGCGRGEWLELLTGQGGYEPYGVDLDEGMLAVCAEYKLNYQLQDALSCLKGLADDSQLAVTGFHIAEHIPFEDLQQLVQESLRVLKPGGLLILETPNSENLVVATTEFYMDPTHSQPIPANLLAFVPEFYGFQSTKIVRLQENQALTESDDITLYNVIKEVSPDYAVIAQKSVPEPLQPSYDDLFSKDYGITLEALANKAELNINNKIGLVQTQLQLTEQKSEQFVEQIKGYESKQVSLEQRFSSLKVELQEANTKLLEAQNTIIALRSSSSWRVTKPLRASTRFIKSLFKRR